MYALASLGADTCVSTSRALSTLCVLAFARDVLTTQWYVCLLVGTVWHPSHVRNTFVRSTVLTHALFVGQSTDWDGTLQLCHVRTYHDTNCAARNIEPLKTPATEAVD